MENAMNPSRYMNDSKNELVQIDNKLSIICEFIELLLIERIHNDSFKDLSNKRKDLLAKALE